MHQTHLNRASTIPWWAAFGAPLLGVPLIVGLLAWSAPAVPESDTATEPGVQPRAEWIYGPVEPAGWKDSEGVGSADQLMEEGHAGQEAGDAHALVGTVHTLKSVCLDGRGQEAEHVG